MLSGSNAIGMVYIVLSWGLKKETRLLAEFFRYAINNNPFLMIATSLPFGMQNGADWSPQPPGLRRSCSLPKPLGRKCAVTLEDGSWQQESQGLTAACCVHLCEVCWLLVVGGDSKTMRLLHACVTDIHSGEMIWESNSELDLVKEFYKNSLLMPHCIPTKWVFLIFFVNMHKNNSQRKCILEMAVYHDK